MGRVAILIGLLIGAGVARADADASAALARYQNGLRHYNLSDWKASLEEFRAAYLAKPDPSFLFNIGQCQRQLGDFDAAEKSYRAFLREATDLSATQVEQVKRLINQMQEAVAERRMQQPPTGVAPPEHTAVASPAPAPMVVRNDRPAKPLYKRWWLWTVVGGVVVVGAVIGLGVGLSTHSTTYPNGGPSDAAFTF